LAVRLRVDFRGDVFFEVVFFDAVFRAAFAAVFRVAFFAVRLAAFLVLLRLLFALDARRVDLLAPRA